MRSGHDPVPEFTGWRVMTSPVTAGDFRPTLGKLCPACRVRGEWPGQPCPECKSLSLPQRSVMVSITSTPSRTVEQQFAALKQANWVRSQRAALKRDLRAGVSVVPFIEQPPSWLGSMKIFDLLVACPRVGRVKASKCLKASDVSPSRTLAGLTARQRMEVVRRWGR